MIIELSSNTEQLITSAVKCCKMLKIDTLVIDDHGIRGKRDETGVYLLESGDFGDLGFDSLVVARVIPLCNRLEMFERLKIDYTISAELKVTNDVSYVRKLVITGDDGTVVGFNCAHPTLATKKQIPKAIDQEDMYKFTISPDSIKFLKRAVSAMGTTTATIRTDENSNVMVDLVDIEGDDMSHILSNSYEVLNTDEDTPLDFEIRFNFSTIMSLLTEAAKDGSVDILIISNNIMKLDIYSLNLYILPEI